MKKNRQSKLMAVYNKARAAARMGKCGLENGRVNRAFGIMMRSGGTSKINPDYESSIDFCKCPDAKKGNICKHRIAHMIEFRLVYPDAPLSEMSDGRFWLAEQFFGRYDVHVFDNQDQFNFWKSSATGRLVIIHKAQGRRGITRDHGRDNSSKYDFIMPPVGTYAFE